MAHRKYAGRCSRRTRVSSRTCEAPSGRKSHERVQVYMSVHAMHSQSSLARRVGPTYRCAGIRMAFAEPAGTVAGDVSLLHPRVVLFPPPLTPDQEYDLRDPHFGGPGLARLHHLAVHPLGVFGSWG